MAPPSGGWVDAGSRRSGRVVPPVEYPSSDGNRMAENTVQFDWIVTLKQNIDAAVADFVAGDLLWYPVEGDNRTRAAPDVMVAFGRPKGPRSSYMQWLEEGIAPQVVMEVTSPGNRAAEMRNKLAFYERFGVQEYYVYDPDHNRLEGYLREGEQLRPIPMQDHVSPRLGIRFHLEADSLAVYHRDGRRFKDAKETWEAARTAEEATARAQAESARAQAESARAQAAEAELEALKAKLRALGISP